MAATAGWNLSEIELGLKDCPRHVSEHLQWITEEGQELYSQRQATVDVFSREETALTTCSVAMAPKLSNQIVIVDLGAGQSTKTIRLLQSLLTGYPERRICYIPVDVSDVILTWREYLEQHYAELSDQVVSIQPVVMDMMEALHSLDSILERQGYSHWELVFSLFGPMSTILHNSDFVHMVREIGQLLKPRSNGGFIFSYLPSHSGLEKRINQEYYAKLDMSAIMKCVLLGLNKVAETDVDPDQFAYEKEYVTQRTTGGMDGEWSGFAIYAVAKYRLSITSDKLDLSMTLEPGERIRLSEDIVKAHYYSDEYISSLALTSGLDIQGPFQEPSGLISAVFIKPSSGLMHVRDYNLYMQTPSPRHG